VEFFPTEVLRRGAAAPRDDILVGRDPTNNQRQSYGRDGRTTTTWSLPFGPGRAEDLMSGIWDPPSGWVGGYQ